MLRSRTAAPACRSTFCRKFQVQQSKQEKTTWGVILSLTTLPVSSAFRQQFSAGVLGFNQAPFRSLGKAFDFAIRPKLVLSQSRGGRKVSPSISSGSTCSHNCQFELPARRGGGLPTQAIDPAFDHSMTQARPHTALHSCAYVQSSRNIQYNLMASLRATATLASARCLRTASLR